MNLLKRLDDSVARIESALIVILLGLMVLAAFSQVVLRNLLGTGLAGSEPLVRYLVLWVGFIGAALAVKQKRHITIEILTLIRPLQNSRLLAAVPSLVSALVCALLTFAAVRFVRDEAEIGTRAFFDLPAWIPELILPAAFGLMTLRFLLRVCMHAAAPAEPPA